MDYEESVNPIVDLRRVAQTRGTAIVYSDAFFSSFATLANLQLHQDEMRQYLTPAICELELRCNRLLIHARVAAELARKPSNRVISLWRGAPLRDFQQLRAIGYTEFGGQTTIGIEGDLRFSKVRLDADEFAALPANARIEITYAASGLAAEPGLLPADLRHALLILAAQRFDYRDGYMPPLRNAVVDATIQRWKIRHDAEFAA